MLALLALLGFILGPVLSNPNGVGVLPVMGWTGYNALMQSSGECAGDFYNETAFLQSAAALTSTGLAAKGYTYLNADDCWLAWNRTASGELAADATRFPHGMSWLASQLHAQGFKLGLYAAASLLTCRNYPGSQEHIDLDAATFGVWEVDFVKLDSCACPSCTEANNSLANGTHSWAKQHEAWAHALNHTGRKVVFMGGWAAYFDVCADMLSPAECGRVPWEPKGGPTVADLCHQFRYTWDLFPTWSKMSPHPGGLKETLSYTATAPGPTALRPLSGPGAVLDLDFLVVGCPTDANCEPFSPTPLQPLTDDEQQTQMSMWCILGAPLIIGSDVRHLSPRALATLGNVAAIAIDQDALRAAPRMVPPTSAPEEGIVWARDMANGDCALALLNAGEVGGNFSLPLASLGPAFASGSAMAYNVWTGANASVAAGAGLVVFVQSHETVLLRLTPTASPCCAQSPVLASCFGYAAGGNNSEYLAAALTCGSDLIIDYPSGSDGVWTLDGFSNGAGGMAGFLLANVSNLQVTFAPGVVLEAARGYYHASNANLVMVQHSSNITLVGAGQNTLRMWQVDYANASLYNHSEWRHGVGISDSQSVRLRKLRIEDTGGDGVDISGATTADVSLVDIVTDRAFRNGVSVTGVDGLLIANSSLLNSAGTPPMGGIDLEPASEKMKVNNVTLRNVTIAGNQQIQVSLSLYGQIGVTDNFLMENCTIADGPMSALMLFFFKTNGPLGSMVFRDIVISNAGGAGILFQRNGTTGATVEFSNIVLRDTATAWYSSYGHWPLDISGGGLTLNNITIYDSRPRPFLYGGWYERIPTAGVTGTVTVFTNVSSAVYPACTPYYFNSSTGANSVQVSCHAPSPSRAAFLPPSVAATPQKLLPLGGSANTAPYGNPATGCLPGESPLSVPGIPGSFCSPACSTQGSEDGNICPPAPNGTYSVQGKCNIATDKDWRPSACGLVCERTIYSKNSKPTVCPEGSTCQLAQGYGLCTYPS
jgi:hypothetical protein